MEIRYKKLISRVKSNCPYVLELNVPVLHYCITSIKSEVSTENIVHKYYFENEVDMGKGLSQLKRFYKDYNFIVDKGCHDE